MKRKLVIAASVVGVLGLAAGGTWLWYWQMMTSPLSRDGGRVEVTLDDGATFDQAVDVLRDKGLVPDGAVRTLLFRLRARLRGKRVPLRAGLYRFERSMSPDQVMDKLASGPDVLPADMALVFQVVPGDNIFQAARKLKSLGARGDLLAFAKSAAAVDKLGLPLEHRPGAVTGLEGYLFPDSYFLDRKRPSTRNAVRLATARFKAVWTGLKVEHAASYAKLAAELHLTDHDFVTLASLVEAEVRVADEAPLVAAVFYNRLRRGLPLQTDPTLVYGPTTWEEVPAPRHRRDASNPYNTYKHTKLPPGPIANPGLGALTAALEPAQSDALYFVARRDGSGRHAFSGTLSEHESNVDLYLRRPQ